MIKVYTLDDSKNWDILVKSYSDYDTYWLSGYVRAFQIHGDGEPILISYEGEDARGINVIMKRDIANDAHFKEIIQPQVFFDAISPYGYGGWLIEGIATNQLFKEYESWCIDNDIICEFVRFHPVVGNHRLCEDYYQVIGLGNTVTVDLSSPEIVWANITSKNRNMIRKAAKNDVEIHIGSSLELYCVFREIYNSTMNKNNADKYYYFGEDFYDSILNDLPENAKVFYALHDNKIIAASIVLMANGRMNYHLSGSLKEYSSIPATNLLLYKTALWGCEHSYKTLYLGGGVGSGEDSLFRFKKSFYRGDDLNRFHIGKRIFSQEKYDYLLSMRINIDGDVSFFPEYRK